MKLLKNTIFMSLVLLVGACSQAPEPLIKEQVQSSSKEDYEYLKETSKAAPLEIDLYKAIAIAIKNNRDLRFERTATGKLIIMPPTGSETSERNAELTYQLRAWVRFDESES